MKNQFIAVYTQELAYRFANDPEYAYAASRTTPEALAIRMTNGLINGAASKDGPAIKAALKKCGIKPTYKALRMALSEVKS